MISAKIRCKCMLALLLVFILFNSTIVSSQQSNRQRPPLVLPEDTVVKKDIIYRSIDGNDLRLDIYLPPSQQAPMPLVIWVHGGAWRAGSKDYPKHAVKMLEYGFAVASISYRLSQVAKFPAQIEDCKAAVRWLRANAGKYKIDSAKIGVWGSSAGGHLVALLGTAGNHPDWDSGEHAEVSSAVQAVCDWYGPTDFLRMDDYPGRMVHLQPNSPESQLIGGDVRDNPDKVKDANPITYIDSACPPFLIMHGRQDSTVIHQQSIMLHEALVKKGVPAELILIEGADHGGRKFTQQVNAVAEFFKRTLMNHSSP